MPKGMGVVPDGNKSSRPLVEDNYYGSEGSRGPLSGKGVEKYLPCPVSVAQWWLGTTLVATTRISTLM